jgi:hypothetical protein
MGKTARAILNPISLIIGKDATRTVLEGIAIVAAIIPGGQPIAVLAGLELATLYKPTPPKPDTTVTSLKSALAPRVRAYGRSRLYGNYVLFTTATSGVAVDVYSFLHTSGNAIDGIERYYLGDQQVATTTGGVTGLSDGTYSGGNVSIDSRLGHATETAFSLTSLLGSVWDTNHRGDGVVSGLVVWEPVSSKDYQKVNPNGQPALSLVARWLRVYDWRDPDQSLADPSTWKWTENAVLHIADYILTVEKAARAIDEMFPSASSLHIAWERYFAPTLQSWTDSANDADSAIPLKAGGTEPRYRGCVSHLMTDAHKDVKTRLLSCFDGVLVSNANGAITCHSGRYYYPTVEIGPDEITSYSLQFGIDDEDAVNDIAVTYISADHDFSAVATDNWTDEDDIMARGQIMSESLADDVPSWGQARRLAKRKEARSMPPAQGSCVTNSAGRAARGERFIKLRIEEAGTLLYYMPVEITGLTRNLAGGGITFTWIEANPDIDEWDPETEEGNPAPVGDAVTPEALTTPVITSAEAVNSDVGTTPDGETGLGDTISGASATGVRTSVTATGPDRPDLTWYLRWRVGTSGAWVEAATTDTAPGVSVHLISGFVALATNVNVEVQYQVGDGRYSDWSTAAVVDTTV